MANVKNKAGLHVQYIWKSMLGLRHKVCSTGDLINQGDKCSQKSKGDFWIEILFLLLVINILRCT